MALKESIFKPNTIRDGGNTAPKTASSAYTGSTAFKVALHFCMSSEQNEKGIKYFLINDMSRINKEANIK